MFFNFEKYYGLYRAFDISVTRIKMTNEGKCKFYLLNKDNAPVILYSRFRYISTSLVLQ